MKAAEHHTSRQEAAAAAEAAAVDVGEYVCVHLNCN